MPESQEEANHVKIQRRGKSNPGLQNKVVQKQVSQEQKLKDNCNLGHRESWKQWPRKNIRKAGRITLAKILEGKVWNLDYHFKNKWEAIGDFIKNQKQ